MHSRDLRRELPPPTPESRARDAEDDRDYRACSAFLLDHAAGEAEGLYGPTSLTWEIWREPVLLVAGVPAVLLQVAHPAIATGVGRLSNFRHDILGRARRTFVSLYQLVFGDLQEARNASRRLHVLHRRVRGSIEDPGGESDGAAYRANQQELLRWVGATVAMSGLQVFQRYIRRLSEEELDRWYLEYQIASASTGVRPDLLPPTRIEMEQWYEAELRSPKLHITPLAKEVAAAMFNSHITHGPLDEVLAAGLLPPQWRDAFGLPWGPAQKRSFHAIDTGLQLFHRAGPPELRAAVAWHQARLRVARAHGQPESRRARLMNAIDRRIDLPLSIRPIAEGVDD